MRYAAGTAEIPQCFFEGMPIRPEYLIVNAGNLAGTGAGSYTLAYIVEPTQACRYDGSRRVIERICVCSRAKKLMLFFDMAMMRADAS
jgi:hypothetical protein